MYPYGTGVTVSETFTVASVPTDPTSVVWSLIDPTGVVHTYSDGDAEFVHDEDGLYQLDLPGTLNVFPGVWRYEIVGTGAVEATANGEYTILQPAVAVPVPYAESGPCSPWCDADDVWTTCGEPVVPAEGSLGEAVPVDMTPYTIAASWLLWMLSGRLFSGRCEKTVRPCSDRPCGFQVLSRGHIVSPADAYGWGWGWNGSNWYSDGSVGCDCTPLDRIELSGYPVRDIVEVKIDGVIVPETNNWRLDKRRFLTRKADAEGNAQSWPACQRRDMDDTEPGTFSVTYMYGQDVPLLGGLAAAQVACELYASSIGGDCKLPNGTVRVSRQGITIDKLATLGWFKGSSVRYGVQARWQTGLPLVDAFLNGANPYGLSRRPVMMAPGNRRGRFAQSVGQ